MGTTINVELFLHKDHSDERPKKKNRIAVAWTQAVPYEADSTLKPRSSEGRSFLAVSHKNVANVESETVDGAR